MRTEVTEMRDGMEDIRRLLTEMRADRHPPPPPIPDPTPAAGDRGDLGRRDKGDRREQRAFTRNARLDSPHFNGEDFLDSFSDANSSSKRMKLHQRKSSSMASLFSKN